MDDPWSRSDLQVPCNGSDLQPFMSWESLARIMKTHNPSRRSSTPYMDLDPWKAASPAVRHTNDDTSDLPEHYPGV